MGKRYSNKKNTQSDSQILEFSVTALILILSLIFVLFASNQLYIGNVSAASGMYVAAGTSMLAGLTFYATSGTQRDSKIREYERKQDLERGIALKRLEEFYSPLIKIFSADPESIINNKKVVSERANEMVSILKGKRYLATLSTVDMIPDNVEEIAFGNWMEEMKSMGERSSYFNPRVGYLYFKNDEQREPWYKFIRQVWKDYDSLVKKYWSDQQKQDKEPTWKFKVKGDSS